MHCFEAQKLLPFSPEQLYNLVLDIEQYPNFLPWCNQAKIIHQDANILIAQLGVIFKIYKETYTSEITCTKDRSIGIKMIKGPFKKMSANWIFQQQSDQTLLKFKIKFSFSSHIFENIASVFLHEVAQKIIESFEKRAKDVYL